jgi:hypothetical protein
MSGADRYEERLILVIDHCFDLGQPGQISVVEQRLSDERVRLYAVRAYETELGF